MMRAAKPLPAPKDAMKFDSDKLKAVILHTCSKCTPSTLGFVKLHKVLYFSDMFYFAETGSPITGATYRKRDFGPTCDQLLDTLDEMDAKGQLKIRNENYFGYRKKEFIPLAAEDTNRLSAIEIELLDEIIDFVCFQNSAKTISEFSHNRAWEMAKYGQILPYHSVFHLFPVEVSPETIAWGEQEAAKIEAARSDRDAVVRNDVRAIRSRVLKARVGASGG